jgi:hypothetical protein
MILPAMSSAASTWQKTTWRGETAWSSINGPVRAVVTEWRARLIYLGSVDGTCNLLNAPYPRVLPTLQDRWPNQGGHRFWLGPQKRWIWPPPTEWEYSAAAQVAPAGDQLNVQHARLSPAYPLLAREYAWDGSRLRCTVRWLDDGPPFFGMHVVPVDLPFTGTAQLVKTGAVPHGVVEVQMDDARPDGFLPHPALTLRNGLALLTAGRRVLKAGFAPQPLHAERAQHWRLTVHPGPYEGIPAGAPDYGYLSQIWVGSVEHDLAELEQLTPYLRGDRQGRCASSIYIEATPPAA